MHSTLRDRVRVLLLLALVGSITIGLQAYVGYATIYSPDLEAKRQQLHRAILLNQPPNGTSWDEAGALTMNVRVGAIYLAEGIHRVTGLSLGIVYVLLDTAFLFLALVSLFFYLRKWLPDTYCLIGLLYFCSILPLSYALHHFHPYDRMQLVFWISLLYLIRERKPLLVGVGLVISMIIKYDTILLPSFYYIAHVTRENWQRTSIVSLVLLAEAISVYIVLGKLFPPAVNDPARFHFWTAWQLVRENVAILLSKNIAMPPLLAHGIPLALSLVHLRRRDRFLQASVAFAMGLLAIFVCFSRFDEVRAQLMVVVLLMPTALMTLRCILEPRSAQAPSDSYPATL
jgi:hypothetical protein